MKKILLVGIILVVTLAFWLNKGYDPKSLTESVGTPRPTAKKEDTTKDPTEIRGNYRNKELGYWLTIPDELTTREFEADSLAIADKKKPDAYLFVVRAMSCRKSYYETPMDALENEMDRWFSASGVGEMGSTQHTIIVSSEGNKAYIERLTTYYNKPTKRETVGPVYVYLLPKDDIYYCAITIDSLNNNPHPTEEVKQQMDAVAKSLVFD